FGHYEGLLVWLRQLADTGYVADEALRRLIVVEDVDAALAACAPTR
ncbi:MAG: TIGR00730 family Rossman fold protein, partial [Actinomycetota bacterium]|nr:TIGR00730 family Rossman fold protein [Actinomycetota bacterium]